MRIFLFTFSSKMGVTVSFLHWVNSRMTSAVKVASFCFHIRLIMMQIMQCF
jgi:hypothetical protein